MLRLSILITLLVSHAVMAAAHDRSLIEGLDHTPVAVLDLDRASADFSKLGFIIKPGRPHDDGIRNEHIKFPNGGSIELITASSPTDALAQEYVAWLRGGDGPAFWSLYAPDLASLASFLSEQKLSPHNSGDLVTFSQSALPHRLFFADRLRSPTDNPKYWAHPNTAYKLAAVWLAGTAPELRILSLLGAKRSHHDRCSPFDMRAAAFILPGEGDLVMAAPAVHRSQERSIIGVTVFVKSLVAARSLLDANHVPYLQPKECLTRSVWITPANAHNLWLELYERPVA